ncbi:MAG: hypothetical protein MR689_01360, partial [Bacteroidales bacterium]|nr:hypothetical protein [Bacteroidales bacterium]
SNIFFIMNNTPGNAQRQGAEPRRASTLNAISNPKPHFLCKHSNFWFVYAKGIPKEPSLWFVVYVVCLKSDMPHHQRQVRSTGIAKRLFFYVFVSVPQYFSTEPFSY